MSRCVRSIRVRFGLMFLASLFVGRLWCGWACPAGALQEFAEPVNNKRTPGGRFNFVKWVVWVPWLAILVWITVQAGGIRSIQPLYQLEGGVTLTQPYWFMIYYIVVALFLGLALILGRRAACHTLCWMAPFMMVGRRIRNRFGWPALQLAADPTTCTNCQLCTRLCPMSLDVNAMVQQARMENGECILCGSCVDNCPKGSIRFSFSGGE